MASERQSYPYVPTKSWWALRKKFNQSIPAQITPSYIVAVLGGTEASAKRNVLLGLKAVGLVDEDGSTTERAKVWRDDDDYSDVCRQIVDEIYPAELLSALPGPAVDKGAAKRWFMTTTGCGEPTAGRMAATYALLAEADPSAGDEAQVSKPKKTRRAKPKGQPTPSGGPPPPQPPSPKQDPPQAPGLGLELPEMRLNVEIRIDASVTPEQIDLIFASMAKHLYHRDDERQ